MMKNQTKGILAIIFACFLLLQSCCEDCPTASAVEKSTPQQLRLEHDSIAGSLDMLLVQSLNAIDSVKFNSLYGTPGFPNPYAIWKNHIMKWLSFRSLDFLIDKKNYPEPNRPIWVPTWKELCEMAQTECAYFSTDTADADQKMACIKDTFAALLKKYYYATTDPGLSLSCLTSQ